MTQNQRHRYNEGYERTHSEMSWKAKHESVIFHRAINTLAIQQRWNVHQKNTRFTDNHGRDGAACGCLSDLDVIVKGETQPGYMDAGRTWSY
jgi:hypothetical protein